jgi:outer membrane protein TolC
MMRSLQHYSAFSLATCLCLLEGVISPAWSREIMTSGEKLTLERAIELTPQNHPRGLEVESEAAAARARVSEARSALMPQVLAAGEYLRSTDNPSGNTTFLGTPASFLALPGWSRWDSSPRRRWAGSRHSVRLP